MKKAGLNKRQIEAVEHVKKQGNITNSDYQNLCNVSESTALRDLEELSAKGIFHKKGEKKGTYYELKGGG
ncbi:MAG: DeoR family transcriptional regulator [Cyclobacteriaceae bacterium]